MTPPNFLNYSDVLSGEQPGEAFAWHVAMAYVAIIYVGQSLTVGCQAAVCFLGPDGEL